MTQINRFTSRELEYMEQLENRIDQLCQFLKNSEKPKLADSNVQYRFLTDIKKIQGNANNDVSFIATLMAKQYLINKYDVINFDAAIKAQGAPGLDIDITLMNGDRLIAEIKTTIPYLSKDFGAQQKMMIKKDFLKLEQNQAKHKLFLVTEKTAFDLLRKQKFVSITSGIEIILLPYC